MGPDIFEKVRVECFLEALFLNVINSKMHEHARLYVAIGIDVEVLPASGNTAVYIWSVIPEITNEKWPVITNISLSPPNGIAHFRG